LGGYLTWTALAREIHARHAVKTIPVELHGKITKLINSPVFYNNPHFIQEFGEAGVQVQLNNSLTNYCEIDTSSRAVHKSDKHIIETICSAYGFENVELKCEMFLDKKEDTKVQALLKLLPEDFVTIEPHSNVDYTVNRAYPFKKWEKIVGDISTHIPVVQIGTADKELLSGAIDFRGKTTFRTAGGIIEKSKLLLSTEGGLTHLATAFRTPALVILTGYQPRKMVEYPQNTYIDISSHGPCGLKIACKQCIEDAKSHNFKEVSELTLRYLETV